jgi:sulfur carrier protein ThiS
MNLQMMQMLSVMNAVKMNRNSKDNTYTQVVNEETKIKENLARLLDSMGYSKEGIATMMGLSISRINEYLK